MTESPRMPLRKLVASCAFLLGVLRLLAADSTSIKFDLPADTADRALKRFSEQANVDVLIDQKIAHDVHTLAVTGEMSPRQALDAMLADSGLVVFQDPKSGAFTVRRETALESKNVNRAIAESSARPEKTDARYETDEKGEKVLKLDTFEVFGKKTLNMDIQRTRDDVQPYVVFDRQTIENSGATNLEDFLRTRLPMNTQIVAASQQSQSTNNLSAINLRGLGTNQTLILVDGMRLPSINQGLNGTRDFRQADINGIPLSAIERVEVLPTTASGIYGGGATGGVLNIILKRNYTGAEVSAMYGNTFDFCRERQEYALTAGFTLEGGRTRIMITADYQKSGLLRASDRPFSQRDRETQLILNPPAITANPPLGYTANILSATIVGGVRQPLVLDTGVALNSILTSVPVGYAGVASDNGAAFLARAGIYNWSLADDNSGSFLVSRKTVILNNPQVRSLGINARREFGPRIEVFADYLLTKNEVHTIPPASAVSLNQVTIPSSAPNNPFQQDIIVRFPTPSLPSPSVFSTSETTRVLVGGIVRLPHDWMAEFDYSWSRSKSEGTFSTQPQLTAAGAAALRDGTLDVIKDVNLFPVDYVPYLNSTIVPSRIANDKTEHRDATFRFNGTIFKALNNPVAVSGYVESRDEKAFDSITESRTATATSFTYIPERRQSSESAYIEAKNLVIAEDRKIPFLRNLQIQASGRIDRVEAMAVTPSQQTLTSRTGPFPILTPFRNKTTSSSFTGGVKVEPIEGIEFRLSYGSGFLAPSVSQIVGNAVPTPVSFISDLDPKRGNTPISRDGFGNVRTDVTNVDALITGLQTLKPETSDSYSAGVIIKPAGTKGLRLAVDFLRIKKKDEISSFVSTATLLANENFLPGRIVRGPNLPGDLPGWSGPVIGTDNTSLNFSETNAEFIDIQGTYEWKASRAGNFEFYATATRSLHLQRRVNPLAPLVENVDAGGGPLKWRGNLGLTWRHGVWSAGWNMQYYSDYSVPTAGAAAATAQAQIALQGSSRISAQRYHDIFVRYSLGRVDHTLFANTSISVGIQNVFDSLPPYAVNNGGLYSAYGDPQLRRFQITLKRDF